MFQNNLIAGASGQGGFYPTELEQSLRFNDDDSAYLSRTFSAGDRKTWTWSGWVKRGNLGVKQHLFGTIDLSVTNRQCYISFESSNTLTFVNYTTSGFNYYLETTQLFRDPSAWYHISIVSDTTQATAGDRLKIYVNGVRVTSFSTATYPSQNFDGWINADTGAGVQLGIGRVVPYVSSDYFDGYLAEVNFIDGTALDPTSFGEFKSGIWVPKAYAGAYGTNGFYLPFKQTTVANGFNTVLWTGNASTQSIEGVGFAPDLIWGKKRTDADGYHVLIDPIRGGTKPLFSNVTNAEATESLAIQSFDADGWTMGSWGGLNESGKPYVGWCWDAGSGSPVSNTNGSITSTVKANPDYGFSVVSYTGAGTTSSTVGHGLSFEPDVVIVKNRDSTDNWVVGHSSLGWTGNLFLNTTGAFYNDGSNAPWADTAPTSSVFFVSQGGGGWINASGVNYIAYCFAEVAGYSSFGSYTGTSADGNKVTTGFKPAFVLVKCTSSADDWAIHDATRDTDDAAEKRLRPNSSGAELTSQVIDFVSDGFELNGSATSHNESGQTYIYMAFADTRDAAFWRDLSGNDNTWQPNAVQNSDVLLDSPTNNFCTFNSAIRPYPNADTLSEGNLKRTNTVTGVTGSNWGTFSVTSGKWYYETAIQAAGGLTCWIGWANDAIKAGGGTYTSAARDNAYMYMSSGNKALNSNTGTAYGASYNTGDVIGVALDADNDTITFYKNGVSQGVAFTGISTIEAWIPASSSDPGWVPVFNFGQDSSFAGNKTAQGNTDANGVGDFYYAPPSGYLALCTANLPDPVIDPAQDDVPADYFNTVLWTGDNSASRNITGFGFDPDFVWSKTRSEGHDHRLTDKVRGAAEGFLSSNTTGTPSTDFGRVLSFITDGIEIGYTSGDANGINGVGDTTVAWAWLAGNGTSSNSDGTITSTVSVNQKAGFSIVSYTGNGTAGATVGHSLGAAPDVLLVKRRSAANDWQVYHSANTSAPETDYLILNQTLATIDTAATWNDTAPTSSVFTVGNGTGVNNSSDTYIAYCFAEVEGYSKFGSYTGNGSADGPFVYCGFRPAWVMTKESSATSDWYINDILRDTYNVADFPLSANASDAEPSSATQDIDLLSNGFKIRNNGGGRNTSGNTYIFMAFAESPFKYANAR